MNIANGVRLSSMNPMRQYAAATMGSQLASSWSTTGSRRNIWTAASASPKAGWPDGYRDPYAWLLPSKPGTLSSRYIIFGTGGLTASGALGRNLTATMTGTGTLTATGQLIASAIATLTGSGTISSANLVAILQATATLTGAGSLTATPTALGWMEGDLTGVGTLTATPFGTGELTATIAPSVGEELSPEAVAAAVWAAIAITNSDSGSMGEKLNAALTIAKFLGLK